MLHSSTTVRSSHPCARRGIRQRRGHPGGEDWPGFLAGQIFHEHMGAELVARGATAPHPLPEPRPLGLLSPTAQQAHRVMAERLNDMGYLDPPSGAVVEASYLLVLDADGTPKPFDIDADGDPCPTHDNVSVQLAPEWARRGDHWDPSQADLFTAYRLQPDVHFIGRVRDDDGKWYVEAVIWDWKTPLGLIGHQRLAEDPQTITYCAAIGRYYAERPNLPTPDRVRFVYVNPRYLASLDAVATLDDWTEAARSIWQGCYEQDQVDADRLDALASWGPHCSTCSWVASCRPNTPAAMTDAARHREITALAEKLKRMRADERAALRERTSAVVLHDGTVLGPVAAERVSLPRKTKANPEGKAPALRAAMDQLGPEWVDHFDTKGSAGAWLEGLPEAAAQAVEPFVTRKQTTTYKVTPASVYAVPGDDGEDG